jgi:ribosomal protein S27AE
MRLRDRSLKPESRNPCPICGAQTTLAECVPHPLQIQFQIHGYLCDRCGPVKSLVVRAYPPEARQ